jgi:DNA-binding MarR family transcriptional regulator
MTMNPEADRQLLITLLAAAARLERRLDNAVSRIKGVSFSEYQLLLALQGKHNATAMRVDLAASIGLTPSGVTRALKPLEKIGYVRTVRDDRDARRSLAKLTPQGTTLLADATGVVNDVLSEVTPLRSLRAAERDRTLQLLHAIAHG